MTRAPILTHDGFFIMDSETEPSLDNELGVPKLAGIMRLEETSDTLRGVISDFSADGLLKERCALIGRSGHSQIGLDIDFDAGMPILNSRRRCIDLPIQIMSLNPNIPDALFSEIKAMMESNRKLTIGRLFIPMVPSLTHDQVKQAEADHHILLPPGAEIDSDGVVILPLENTHYLLSNTLLSAGHNTQVVLHESKEGLGLIQYSARSGRPEMIPSCDFLCSSMRISLGPYNGLIDRDLNEAGVFHLAARLLDAVRTSGINTPRQVELFNSSDHAVLTQGLQVRVRLYPTDPATAAIANQLLSSNRAMKIIRDGVDFADATNIFNIKICDTLFDSLGATPTDRGNHSRLLTRNKCTVIQRELLENEWHENAQNRIIYEVVRGTITSGVHTNEQISPDIRAFTESLELVGGAQNLRRVFVTHEFPCTDTLRVLKRNNVGVFIGRSIRLSETAENDLSVLSLPPLHNIYFGQTTYETFCDLTGREGARFYMIFGEGDQRHIREFYHGFWMTREGKEKIVDIHTMVAMFGSHVEGTAEVLTGQIQQFFAKLRVVPEIDGALAICHGSGPGVMKIADDAAASQSILSIGIGIDSEKVGQRPNLRPPVLLNFNNSARHMRQNILDRTSLFKIYNIGGMGTLEEVLIAITNLKLFESLPAPHIFVDPFNLGENSTHLWESTLEQLRSASSLKTIGSHSVRLAPAWVPNFCHLVRDYDAVLEIITDFVRDPDAYWEKTGIPDQDLLLACDNAVRAEVIIPPYLQRAIKTVRDRNRVREDSDQ